MVSTKIVHIEMIMMENGNHSWVCINVFVVIIVGKVCVLNSVSWVREGAVCKYICIE